MKTIKFRLSCLSLSGVILAVLCLFSALTPGRSQNALDQQQVESNNAFGPGTNWQSFTAGQTGLLTKVEVHVRYFADVTLSIYEGEGTSGTLLHRQTYKTAGLTDYHWFSCELLQFPFLIKDQQYTIQVGKVNWSFKSGNPYKAGTSGHYHDWDFLFKTYMASSTLDQQQATRNNALGTSTLWQSFTAGQTGSLTRIDAHLQAFADLSVKVYAGEGTSGRILHEQVFPKGPESGYHWFTAHLNKAVPIEKGNQYTIQIGRINWSFKSGNPYGGGTSNHYPDWDFLFKTYSYSYSPRYYQVQLELSELKVDYDGDWGVHDPGEIFWEISLDGQMITQRTAAQYKTLWEGNTYRFKNDLLDPGKSASITLPRSNLDDVTYDLKVHFFEKDDKIIEDFGVKHYALSLDGIRAYPGERAIKIKNDKGNLTLFFRAELQTMSPSGEYISPSYPDFRPPEHAKPIENLGFVLTMTTSEQQNGIMSSRQYSGIQGKIDALTADLTTIDDLEEQSLALAGITAELAIAAWAEGPVVGGVMTGMAALVNGIAQPFIFAEADYYLTLFVTNHLEQPLKIKDFFRAQGTYVYGPPDGVIPGKVGDKVSVGVFVFRKDYGYFGAMGAIEFGAYGSLPTFKIGYGIPYRDNAALQRKNQCAVAIGDGQNLHDFYHTKLDENTFVEKSRNQTMASGFDINAHIGSGVNTTMYVDVKSAPQ